MLGRYANVFLAYGNAQHLTTKTIRQIIDRVIAQLISEGCRFDFDPIDSSFYIGSGGDVFSDVRRKLDEADGAIIILSPTDRAKPHEAGPLSKSELRARQNVIHEWGFLQSRLPTERILIIQDNEVAVPSNASGVHTLRLDMARLCKARTPDKTTDGQRIIENISALVTKTLKCPPIKIDPLRDQSWPINLLSFSQDEALSHATDIELDWLRSLKTMPRDDAILFAYERVVFDVYQTLGIFTPPLRHKPAHDNIPLASELELGLGYIARYQQHRADGANTVEVFGVQAEQLRILADRLDSEPLAPVVRVALLDYLGLSQMHAGMHADAAASFRRCLRILHDHENRLEPVWEGFVRFNLARTLNEMRDPLAVEELKRAIATRHTLATQVAQKLPIRIRMGFECEYAHAIWTLISWQKDEEARRALVLDNEHLLRAFLAADHLPFALRRRTESRVAEVLNALRP